MPYWITEINCFSSEVTFQPLPQPIVAGIQFNDHLTEPELTCLAWLHTKVVYPPEDGHPS